MRRNRWRFLASRRWRRHSSPSRMSRSLSCLRNSEGVRNRDLCWGMFDCHGGTNRNCKAHWEKNDKFQAMTAAVCRAAWWYRFNASCFGLPFSLFNVLLLHMAQD